MAELADAQDLGSCIERCVGSSPTGRIDIKKLSQIDSGESFLFVRGVKRPVERENALNTFTLSCNVKQLQKI